MTENFKVYFVEAEEKEARLSSLSEGPGQSGNIVISVSIFSNFSNSEKNIYFANVTVTVNM